MDDGMDRERIRNKNEFKRIRETGYWKVWDLGITTGRKEGSIIRNLAGF
jgi:hypothetical protein